MKGLLATILFVLFLQGQIFAQADYREGYIIKLNKDTLRGQVQFWQDFRNYNHCVFNGGGGAQKFAPEDIAAYGFINGEKFISSDISNQFIEILVLGEISLFKDNQGYYFKEGINRSVYLSQKKELKKIDGKLIGVRFPEQVKSVLISMARNCPQLQSKISNTTINEERLIDLVSSINSCINAKYVVVDKKIEKIQLNYWIGTSVKKSYLNFMSDLLPYSQISPISTYNLSHVFLVDLSSPKFGERVNFSLGFGYQLENYSNYEKIRYEEDQAFSSINLEINRFIFPVAIKKIVQVSENRTISFQTGINFEVLQTKKIDHYLEIEHLSTVETLFLPLNTLKTKNVSFTLGMSTNTHIGKMIISPFVDAQFAPNIVQKITTSTNQGPDLKIFNYAFAIGIKVSKK